MHRLFAVVAILALTGCASHLPQEIRIAPEPEFGVEAARQEPGRFLGQRVRWGGTILGVHNRPQVTEIEILARPLDPDGEPQAQAPGVGRFIAEVPGFVDPAEYPTDRRLTVAGKLDRMETRPVGEFPYRYPVVIAASLYLWSEPLPPYPYRHPYAWPWYDPWYYPGYGPWYGPWW
jgi:outer membrane lipoprotein